jgi:Acetokinase family
MLSAHGVRRTSSSSTSPAPRPNQDADEQLQLLSLFALAHDMAPSSPAAGVGENTAAIRERACRDGAWLGIDLDAEASPAGLPRISTPGSRVSARVIPTNEERMIGRHTRRLLQNARGRV